MKLNVILFAIAIFVLGGLVSQVTPPSVSAEMGMAQVSPIELTLKARSLPVQAADAI
jgi:hypothetical protein